MTTIEKNVMANVALVYSLRKLGSLTALEIYLCFGCLWALGRLVWVSKVFENLTHAGVAHSAQFLIAAVLNTDVLVQLVLAVGICAAFLLARDFVRSTPRTFAA